MSEFIPIYQFAKLHSISLQKAYRLIREGKFDDKDLTVEVKEVRRIRIREDAQVKNKLS